MGSVSKTSSIDHHSDARFYCDVRKYVKNCLCFFFSEVQDFVYLSDWLIKYRFFTIAWCTAG